tara:strand:- start:1183 stop:1362 length:180 start_codon:yes stop_codon:yes gene_type:complete
MSNLSECDVPVPIWELKQTPYDKKGDDGRIACRHLKFVPADITGWAIRQQRQAQGSPAN